MSAEKHGLADSVQDRLAEFALRLGLSDLPEATLHAAKLRLIDTLGVLLAGFSGTPCRIARDLAGSAAPGQGATILGTARIAPAEMAAFANGTAARYLEYNDVYHFPGSSHGHPSDVIAPILAAAEAGGAIGAELLLGIVLGYEIYGHASDSFANRDWDNSNYCTVAAAVGAGRMLGLDRQALKACISMAVVPNNVLRQVRRDRFMMWKEVASGHAARSAVFAALLARAGMEGPPLPFEGMAGWHRNVMGAPLAVAGLGEDWKILHSRTRHRPAMGEMHAAIFAAEAIGPLPDPEAVTRIRVETYRRAVELVGTGAQFWAVETRECGDHSIPYVVAAALLAGELTPKCYDPPLFGSAGLRGLLAKIEVIESEDFTADYNRVPRQQRARVRVDLADGRQLVGEAGGDGQDLAAEKSDRVIEAKFRALAEPLIGRSQADELLELIWRLETQGSLAALPKLCVIR